MHARVRESRSDGWARAYSCAIMLVSISLWLVIGFDEVFRGFSGDK